MNGRLSITEVAKAIGVTPRTIMRWEKSGKIKRSKRDWRGWRFYQKEELDEIRRFYESSYEYNGNGVETMETIKSALVTGIFIAMAFALSINDTAYAQGVLAKTDAVKETQSTVDIDLNALPARQKPPSLTIAEAVKYTLGPDDVIEIDVRRHAEFSGQYTVTSEGKIEYKFVGDILVTGLTKTQLAERLSQVLSEYIMEPEVNIRIVSYLSKVFYVVGEVGQPGKFYMRGNDITVREALIQSGLPTHEAAMRRCRIVTPNQRGNNYKYVNVYELLYGGDLRQNFTMKPGDVLYVPATVMAKIIRVISPATNATTQAAGAAATGAALATAAL